MKDTEVERVSVDELRKILGIADTDKILCCLCGKEQDGDVNMVVFSDRRLVYCDECKIKK